ncbi:MAG: hypothetical protein Q4C30_07240 [Bacteroidia bacterium]|nr:hypothetical protein [Bacteroidia bacterium]
MVKFDRDTPYEVHYDSYGNSVITKIFCIVLYCGGAALAMYVLLKDAIKLGFQEKALGEFLFALLILGLVLWLLKMFARKKEGWYMDKDGLMIYDKGKPYRAELISWEEVIRIVVYWERFGHGLECHVCIILTSKDRISFKSIKGKQFHKAANVYSGRDISKYRSRREFYMNHKGDLYWLVGWAVVLLICLIVSGIMLWLKQL